MPTPTCQNALLAAHYASALVVSFALSCRLASAAFFPFIAGILHAILFIAAEEGISFSSTFSSTIEEVAAKPIIRQGTAVDGQFLAYARRMPKHFLPSRRRDSARASAAAALASRHLVKADDFSRMQAWPIYDKKAAGRRHALILILYGWARDFRCNAPFLIPRFHATPKVPRAAGVQARRRGQYRPRGRHHARQHNKPACRKRSPLHGLSVSASVLEAVSPNNAYGMPMLSRDDD